MVPFVFPGTIVVTAPTITTQNLVLRPLTKATQRQVDWLRDQEVVRYSEQRHKDHTLASQLRYVQSMNADGSFIWAIVYAANDRHIGNLTAAVDGPNLVADVGILIGDRDYWGRALGTEAWRAATLWLLDKGGGNLRKLEAGCMATNIAMRRVLDHTGFAFEGERKNRFLYGDQPVGAVLYGKFR